MHDEITESISFQKGYDKGFADAQEYLSKKFEKILSKNANKSYDKGYQDGANQNDNKPCVCGFWGSNKYVAEWHKDCENGK